MPHSTAKSAESPNEARAGTVAAAAVVIVVVVVVGEVVGYRASLQILVFTVDVHVRVG